MFDSRIQAGEMLTQRLTRYKGRKDTVVIGIPRGGVVVASIIAKKLGTPIDIVVVKKIGAPTNPELAIGAVGPQKTVYWDDDLCRRLGVSRDQKSTLKNQKLLERKEREKMLRGKKKPLGLSGKTVILTDDGVATGATVIVASKFLRKGKVKEIVLAVPVIAQEVYRKIAGYFDRIIAIEAREEFYAVGEFYKEFPQVEDNEVIKILSGK